MNAYRSGSQSRVSIRPGKIIWHWPKANTNIKERIKQNFCCFIFKEMNKISYIIGYISNRLIFQPYVGLLPCIGAPKVEQFHLLEVLFSFFATICVVASMFRISAVILSFFLVSLVLVIMFLFFLFVNLFQYHFSTLHTYF